MNLGIITGRTAKDIETFKSKSDVAIGKLVVAVDTGFGENKETNFIPVTVFGKTAEFCEKYINKGRMIEVVGRMKTGSYEKKDGTKVPTFEIIADEIKALDKAKEKATEENPSVTGFSVVESEDLPF